MGPGTTPTKAEKVTTREVLVFAAIASLGIGIGLPVAARIGVGDTLSSASEPFFKLSIERQREICALNWATIHRLVDDPIMLHGDVMKDEGVTIGSGRFKTSARHLWLKDPNSEQMIVVEHLGQPLGYGQVRIWGKLTYVDGSYLIKCEGDDIHPGY